MRISRTQFMHLLLLLSFLALGAGCGPRQLFLAEPLVPLGDVDPLEVRNRFAAALPERFETLSSIIFRYRGRSIAALGSTVVDTVERRFGVACINPLGVKLFELSGDKDSVEYAYMHDEFKGQGDFAGVVAEDVKRVYFDLLPDDHAEVTIKDKKIIFRQESANQATEFIFAGKNTVLIEKRYFEKNKRIWRVQYFEYFDADGKLHPKGIVLRNYMYNYTLTIHLRELMS